MTACALLAVVAGLVWHGRGREEPAAEPAAAAAAPRPVAEARAAVPERTAPPLEAGVPAPGDDHGHEPAPPDPTGDLALYAEYPMSEVPHQVVRAWGVGPGSRSPGHVSAYVVVDPGIGDAQLERLARDIRDYHDAARALSVRIVDDERAATYDRHVDGGDLLARSLVGRVQHSETLGLDEIELRGRRIEDSS